MTGDPQSLLDAALDRLDRSVGRIEAASAGLASGERQALASDLARMEAAVDGIAAELRGLLAPGAPGGSAPKGSAPEGRPTEGSTDG